MLFHISIFEKLCITKKTINSLTLWIHCIKGWKRRKKNYSNLTWKCFAVCLSRRNTKKQNRQTNVAETNIFSAPKPNDNGRKWCFFLLTLTQPDKDKSRWNTISKRKKKILSIVFSSFPKQRIYLTPSCVLKSFLEKTKSFSGRKTKKT